ncbi:MAG: hypothetical protein WBA22_14345 [Candidatus Methanofastidiosia archaeon]
MKLFKRINEKLDTERFWLFCVVLTCAELGTLASIALISLYYGELLVTLISAILLFLVNCFSRFQQWNRFYVEG